MEITPEMQAAIDAAVNAATERLTAKNAELVKEVRNLKSAKSEAETAKNEAEEKAARDAGNVEDLERQLKQKHEREIKDLNDKLSERDKKLATLTIDNYVTDALAKAGIKSDSVDVVTAYLKSGAEMRDGEAMRGDKTLADATTDWLKSDAAKAFIAAPRTSGSGANGSTSTVTDRWSKKPETDADFRELGELANNDPAQYNAVIERHSLPASMKV